MAKVNMGIDDGDRHERIEVEFPSNSINKKIEPTNEKKVEKVVSGKVTKRKKPLSRKIVETFVGEDVVDIKGYIIHDIAVPAAKNMIADIFKSIPEMLFFGGMSRGSSYSSYNRDRGRSYVSYDRQSDRDRRDQRNISQRGRANHNFDEIVLENRGEAERVIDQMCDLIQEYREATVADLYDSLGISQEYTDRSYGWTNLSSARVVPVRGGYVLDLPRPIVLR